MKGFTYLTTAFLAILPALAIPTGSTLQKKADSSKVGYLAVYWTTEDNSVYFALSSNDDALGFKSINGGKPIVSPTLGTKAVRDTSIIAGQGKSAGKFYILGTDLNIDATNWEASTRTGSRGLFVWESTDLVTWGNERLVTVEDETAGMAWAPDAYWDSSKGQYFVHWASQLYSADDTDHTGEPTLNTSMRYSYTSDFKTFTTPETYVSLGDTTVIDMAFLEDENTLTRFYVTGGGPVEQTSTNGLFGDWTTAKGTIENSSGYEAPYAFWDNVENGLAYLLCDKVGSVTGNHAWQSTDQASGTFTVNDTHDLAFMRHLSILPVTQGQYDALSAL
ncbi:hypothetical protein E8E15_004564 [Penicillium rubens]|uniref:Pc18g02260 protein n=2 Tax=Penicillium chrysogenum species complex TaxID=254878 RepID=B6HCV0_PENRW|nr:uncharacterized protein N7525_000760 [Penicillium rubens]KZN91960.1 hypothetical protein EN45_021030 [Penicillium chrysogenum]CAP94450.1 Pc18g02260 [Penicillium rubens Wisconsin 54-1255]KAF3012947.1 hypothetical protein E8E15_004564 [Penicillium rubens]KAJ5039524.1 hypothetical protein NUH16_009307 [Penicillium rubens]KAJ5843019.1 hypothetical protein N7525_000760 [Penicillium rubens]